MFNLFSKKAQASPAPVPGPSVVVDEAMPLSAPMLENLPSTAATTTSAADIGETLFSPLNDSGPLHPDDLPYLIRSVPPQTLHAYTLSHLPNTSPPVLAALATFFSVLTPPPTLHCVRCHSTFNEVQNDDRACRVAHDDESAEVMKIAAGRRASGEGALYETLWACCGKTVEGDGSEGPPDGWCYEGAHTTDARRARFRADSTPTNDKLVPCSRKRCRKPDATPGLPQLPLSVPPSPSSSTTTTRTKKRARPSRGGRKSLVPPDQDGSDAEANDDVAEPPPDTPAKRPRKARAKAMDVDEEKDEENDTASVAGSVQSPPPKRGRPRKKAAPPPLPTAADEGAEKNDEGAGSAEEGEAAPAMNTRARSRSRSRALTAGPPGPLAAAVKPVSKAGRAKSVGKGTARGRGRGRPSRGRVKSSETVEESEDDGADKEEGAAAKRRKVV